MITFKDDFKSVFGAKLIESTVKDIDYKIFEMEVENDFEKTENWKSQLHYKGYEVLTIIDNSSEAVNWNGSVWIVKRK